MGKQNKSNILYFPERITRAMSEIFDFPYTIVEAPMGYGKTISVREFLSNTRANVLWQKIYDNSINTFWTSFCHLFDELDSECCCSLEQLGFPNDNVARQETLYLIKKIKFPDKTVIVIDDYHLIDSLEVNNLIEYLAVNEIPNLFIVLTARFVGFSNMEELKLKKYLNHITKETLEFIPADIAKYYKLCGINLKPFEAGDLYLYTEGWISALYLLMMNYDLNSNCLIKYDVDTLIEKVVYLPLAQDYRDLLTSMSCFDCFTLDQAEFVWNGENPSVIMEELVSKNAFVTFDYKNKSYQMHSILKNFMEEKLEAKDRYYKERLYKNAAKWYMERKEYLSSMHYAYLAGDFDKLLKAVELDRGFGINNDYKEWIIKYFEDCPKETKKRFPLAMIIYARRLFLFNETVRFKKTCDEIKANMKDTYWMDEDYKNRLLGEFELLLSFTMYNDIEKMSEYHRRASMFLKEPSVILDNTGAWTFGSPSVLYMFYRRTGELQREVETIKKAMPYYYQVTKGHGKGAELVMEAERYFYTGDFENAEISVHKAYRAANESSRSGINICCVFLMIRLAFMRGDFDRILDLFMKIRQVIESNKLYLFIHTLDVCEAYVYSCLGIKEHIPEWIPKGEFKNTRLLFPAMAFLNIVYGRVLLIEGEHLKLIGNSEHFIGTASVFPNLLGQIHTYIYLAAANRKISRQNEALDALKRALDIAMPDKVYIPFVEDYDYIEFILEELYRQGIYREDIEKIIELSVQYRKAVQQIRRTHFAEDKPTLAVREIEIAKLAAEGLSNREIGEKLFITENTVKTQLKRVYEKLGINSRVLLKQYFDEEA